MATQITWIIEQMLVKPQEEGKADVVVAAVWRCSGVDGEYSASAYAESSFSLEQGSSFTPYDQLTQDQVLGWCYANGVDKTVVENAVEQSIQDQINPPVITPPLPWA